MIPLEEYLDMWEASKQLQDEARAKLIWYATRPETTMTVVPIQEDVTTALFDAGFGAVAMGLSELSLVVIQHPEEGTLAMHVKGLGNVIAHNPPPGAVAVVRDVAGDHATRLGVDFEHMEVINDGKPIPSTRGQHPAGHRHARDVEAEVAKFRSLLDAALPTWEGGEHEGTD